MICTMLWDERKRGGPGVPGGPCARVALFVWPEADGLNKRTIYICAQHYALIQTFTWWAGHPMKGRIALIENPALDLSDPETTLLIWRAEHC